jgi:branched-chain amino acid transport system permease protein
MRPGLLQRVSVVDLYLWGFRAVVILIVVLGTTGTIRAARYSTTNWIEFVIFGLAQGSIYALIALGYTMVYGILKMINFAHSEVHERGTPRTSSRPRSRLGFLNRNPLVALLVVDSLMVTSAVVALLLERIAIGRCGRARPCPSSQRSSAFFTHHLPRPVRTGFGVSGPRSSRLTIIGISILRAGGVIVAAALMMLLLCWVVMKTRQAWRCAPCRRQKEATHGNERGRGHRRTFRMGQRWPGSRGIRLGLHELHFAGFVPVSRRYGGRLGISNIQARWSAAWWG